MKPIIMVPARLDSKRLPYKLLQKVNHEPIILHVIDQLLPLADTCRVMVVTDSDEVEKIARENDTIEILRSFAPCLNGTERCALASKDLLADQLILNVQADELYVDIEDLQRLISHMEHNRSCQLATLIGPIGPKDAEDRSTVKASIDERGNAKDFTREMQDGDNVYAHHGVYAYRNSCLQSIAKLSPSANEKNRSLEQMRWLDNNYSIHCVYCDTEVRSINTLDDLRSANVRAKYGLQ